MKALLDTSVLVAALLRDHEDHGRCQPWLARAAQGEVDLHVASHSMAELYAVLSGLPARPRLSPAACLRLVTEAVERHAHLVVLSAAETMDVVRRCAMLELAGGVIHDALIARAAAKTRVEALVTLDVHDFQRAWPEGGKVITAP